MTEKTKFFSLCVFIMTGIVISVLVVMPKDFFKGEKTARKQSQFIEPILPASFETGEGAADYGVASYANTLKGAVALGEGEIQTSVLSEDLDGDGSEEQIIVYRNLLEKDNPLYITYIDYDESLSEYYRVWSAPTGITKPGTLSVTVLDLTGDHHNSVVVTGMNQEDAQVLQAFKIFKAEEQAKQFYKKIADLKVDGSIFIKEVERAQSYQMGYAGGESFKITDRRRDFNSANEMDQIENTYTYDNIEGVYKKTGSARISSSHVEAARLNEILSGEKSKFEQFIEGLWYHISSEGTVDNNQYIYFDLEKKEIVFSSETAQQVYKWQNSYSTHYGIYISTQNISIPSLNRKVSIELENLDSINVKVSEDVRMKISMNAPWNGTYRKAAVNKERPPKNEAPFIEGEFNSPIGSIAFAPDGKYKIELNGSRREGRYTFFSIGGNELLEFVPMRQEAGGANDYAAREVYMVLRAEGEAAAAGDFSLARARLGTGGITILAEAPLPLTKVVEVAE